MNNFGEYLTPQQAFEGKHGGPGVTLKELERRAANTAKCCNCDEGVWRLVDLDMCFSCVTGEADAGDDYELGHAEWIKND